jgi:hypothetical protein
MQVGDTVSGYIETFALPTDIVQAIDSVLVGATYRKRWIINPCYNISFIEGIGSTYGLFQRSPACLLDQASYSLTCFAQDGQPVYPDTNTNCQLIMDTENFHPENYSAIISPNPFSEKLIFTINNNELSEITLYDIASKKVLQAKFTSSVSMTTNQIEKGLYLYEVRNKNGLCKRGKVVKE